jgi:farnesyl diphosphate synthase
VRVLPPADAPPRRLHAAMHAAVFPGKASNGSGASNGGAGTGTGGARALVCPSLAKLHGGAGELAGRFAAAVELIGCAARVHAELADLPDDDRRRASAILAGDALLTLAFETLAHAPPDDAPLALRLMSLLAAATGSAHGVIGGDDAALARAASAGAALLAG